jgi:blue copper oxidase
MASSRRGFVIGCGAVAASAVFGGQLGRGKAAPFTTPLPIPRLIDVAATRHTVNLKATSGRHAFIAGKPRARTALGTDPRTCRPRVPRRRMEMVVENHLDAATTVRWHGLLVPGYHDGGPQQLIQAGERWRPVLKMINPPQHSGSIPTRTAIPEDCSGSFTGAACSGH